MPIITDISQQKNKEFYNILVDGEFACGIGALGLSSRGLKVGQELSQTELKQLVDDSVGSKAYNAALRYLSYRPRSEYEVREYLIKKDYAPVVVDQSIDRLITLRFVDDEAFARSWVRSRQATKPRAKRVLAQELAAKHIHKDTITSVLADLVGDDEELNALKQIARKKLQLARFRSDKQKLTQYLMGQGYRYSDVREVLSKLAAENNES